MDPKHQAIIAYSRHLLARAEKLLHRAGARRPASNTPSSLGQVRPLDAPNGRSPRK
jgi:hypothetical protein